MKKNKHGAVFALASMFSGIAVLPVAAFVSTTLGLVLASLSVYFAYVAG